MPRPFSPYHSDFTDDYTSLKGSRHLTYKVFEQLSISRIGPQYSAIFKTPEHLLLEKPGSAPENPTY